MKPIDQYLLINVRTFKSEQFHTKFRLDGIMQFVWYKYVWHFYYMMWNYISLLSAVFFFVYIHQQKS